MSCQKIISKRVLRIAERYEYLYSDDGTAGRRAHVHNQYVSKLNGQALDMPSRALFNIIINREIV